MKIGGKFYHFSSSSIPRLQLQHSEALVGLNCWRQQLCMHLDTNNSSSQFGVSCNSPGNLNTCCWNASKCTQEQAWEPRVQVNHCTWWINYLQLSLKKDAFQNGILKLLAKWGNGKCQNSRNLHLSSCQLNSVKYAGYKKHKCLLNLQAEPSFGVIVPKMPYRF